MKQYIEINNGRAYLHMSGWFDKKRNIKWETIIPLGNNLNYIKAVLEQ